MTADEGDFEVTLRGTRAEAHDAVDVVLRGNSPDHAGAAAVAAAVENVVLYAGQRIRVPHEGLTIGRDVTCALQLADAAVSPLHARIDVTPAGATVTDLRSAAGTFHNGEPFWAMSRPLTSGDSVALGGAVLHFLSSRVSTLPPVDLSLAASSLRLDRAQLVLGRDPTCDIVLDHPNVSPRHAEISASPTGASLRDVSHGGTGCRINGTLISRAALAIGDEIGIGPFRFVFDGMQLQQRAQSTGAHLTAEGVTYTVGSTTILRPSTLTIAPGELVAIIGESGAGKSTLMKSLCGVYRPTAGRVMVDGDVVGARLADIGYVPQDEIVHPLLTVREALGYAAELRLPTDTPAAARATAVERAIAQVGLGEQADIRIGSLSGGQRKRAGVAVELIDEPALLFLDEPTTGLDPGLERRMMVTFRELSDGGRPVVLVTHATRSLSLCDKVIVMGQGGLLCFDGAPAAALDFFGVEHFDDLYAALDDEGAETWHERFITLRGAPMVAGGVPPPPPAVHAAAPPGLIGAQTLTLTRRYMKLFSRDWRNLRILALQVPALGLATGLLFRSDVFTKDNPNEMFSGESAQLLFLLVTVAIWFGAIVAAREIIKERSVVERELAIGVRIPAYLLSKAVVLFSVSGAQTVVLTAIVLSLRPTHVAGAGLNIILLLIATTWVGVAMGLLVSVNVRSEDQATSFIPLILVPQLLFGGAIVPTAQMGFVLSSLSKLFVAQWAFAGIGATVDMNDRIATDAKFSQVSRYGDDFFGIGLAPTLIVLGTFLAILGFALYRRLPVFAGAQPPVPLLTLIKESVLFKPTQPPPMAIGAPAGPPPLVASTLTAAHMRTLAPPPQAYPAPQAPPTQSGQGG